MLQLKEKYQNEVRPALVEEFGYSSVMAAPRIVKIVVNEGLGSAARDDSFSPYTRGCSGVADGD